MYRYVGIIWNRHDEQQNQAARFVRQRVQHCLQAMELAFSTEGLSVFHAEQQLGASQAHTLAEDGGVVVGKLFGHEIERSVVRAVGNLDPAASTRIRSSEGRALIDNYWGCYVAFLCDASKSAVRVLRDPTGGLPCFTMTYREVRIIFSWTEDCAALELARFSIDWNYILATTLYGLLANDRTGLCEVTKVLPGECLQLNFDGSESKKLCYWNPLKIASQDVIEDVVTAVREVRSTARACIGAWASCYPRIVHKLSGGVDSSIVLACLRASATESQITCVNYFDRSVEGDERSYARLVARKTGYPLIEEEWNPSATRFDRLLQIRRSATPMMYALCLTFGDYQRSFFRQQKADAVFGGGGGDQLFWMSGIGAAADYVHRHGFGRNLLAISRDIARLRHCSVWRVLRYAARFGFSVQSRPEKLLQLTKQLAFVNPEAASAVSMDETYLAPPWLRGEIRIEPEKFRHIDALWGEEDECDPYAQPGDLVERSPLLSQPLIELFLRIPTYLSVAGGYDRAIARRAFCSDLPPQVVWRRTKGGINSGMAQVLRGNATFVRDLLLEGRLAKRGLLDRGSIEKLFASKYSGSTPGLAHLLGRHLSTEVWLRSWESAG